MLDILFASNSSTPMSQTSLSPSSENNLYADVDMYGNNTNYMDQVTNGYNQLSISQNADYSTYMSGQHGQQYDPLTDMYFQAPTNYQPVSSATSKVAHANDQLQYHLYTSPPPRRQDLNANQRTPADFFIPDDLRETLQRKNEAAQRVFLDNTLPKNIKGYHSLVPLDTSRDNTGSIRRFGYPSWVYKADSTKFGKKYALRRLESKSSLFP
jgi:hypothetical protein